MTDLAFQPAFEIADRIRRKQVSAAEVVETHLQRIERFNPRLNAYIHVAAEAARRQARAADEALVGGGAIGPLHGVPLSVKSTIEVAGFPSECGSRLRKGVVAEADATLVSRLKRAGAIILGNTNVPDMLMAYETDNLLYGPTRNPWDLERTPGGSSGGESAAIAAGCSAGGFGSDGGGSIRVPAHFCGIYGLKPTPGVIPRTGHWPPCLASAGFSALVGPMARNARDLQVLLEVTAGPDDHDPAACPAPMRSLEGEDLRGFQIGYLEDDGVRPVTGETRQAIQKAAQAFRDLGFVVEPFVIDDFEKIRGLWSVFFGGVASALTKQMLEGHHAELHPFVEQLMPRADQARFPAFEDFLGMWVERDILRGKLLEKMGPRCALLTPVAATPAFRHGERQWTIDGRAVGYPETFSYTQIFNLLSNPAVIAPVGRSAEGLPIGVQIVGRHFEDALIVEIARRLGEALGEWRRPPGF
jgi:Asp-tRNA(Asn)/Glu-tRNA(Gln) amidotransferase A subunit family amidase